MSLEDNKCFVSPCNQQVQSGLIDHQAFDQPHKWSSWAIQCSTVTVDCLLCLLECEHTRNNCLESEIFCLLGEVHLLLGRLLVVNTHNAKAMEKIDAQLGMVQGRMNRHRNLLNVLSKKHNGLVFMQSIEASGDHLDKGNVSPVLPAPPSPPTPTPILPPCCAPHWVTKTTTTLQVISAEEEREIKDKIVSAWQAQERA
ncbi:hypothetical protein BDM02DRAFT_3184565 [Thelephora ganbajun]|uniref:Uncharacterized protein n=1 Tax=Thelephora ganbajun TaxID=370292 RepID=A0ACB6ZNB0_THEGA|nr:hypothetical protein BDM02DRAFT_3184565 [Thelephora ganbajun]